MNIAGRARYDSLMHRALSCALFFAVVGCGASKPDAHAPAAKEETPCDSSAASKCDADRNVCEHPSTVDQPRLEDCEATYQSCMRKAGC
jgi:hypothetical protein